MRYLRTAFLGSGRARIHTASIGYVSASSSASVRTFKAPGNAVWRPGVLTSVTSTPSRPALTASTWPASIASGQCTGTGTRAILYGPSVACVW